MKNNLFMALLLCSLPIMSIKGEPNTLSRKEIMIFQMKTILESDGLKPQMTDDGKLSFGVNGNIYSLEVAQDNDMLYYAKLSRFHKYETNVSKESIDLFNKKINYKAVKVIIANTGYYLRSEFLLQDSQYFKAVYSRLIDLIDKTHKVILDKCPKLINNSNNKSLTINDLKLLTEKTDSTIVLHPMIMFSAPAGNDVEYPVFLRLYRNNALMQNEDSPTDYSCADTLHNQNQPHMMRSWADNSADSASYRCELWYNENCISTSSYSTK